MASTTTATEALPSSFSTSFDSTIRGGRFWLRNDDPHDRNGDHPSCRILVGFKGAKDVVTGMEIATTIHSSTRFIYIILILPYREEFNLERLSFGP